MFSASVVQTVTDDTQAPLVSYDIHADFFGPVVMQNCVEGLGNTKAAGPDGIITELLKAGGAPLAVIAAPAFHTGRSYA